VAVGERGAVEPTSEQLAVPARLCVFDVTEDEVVDTAPEQVAGDELG